MSRWCERVSSFDRIGACAGVLSLLFLLASCAGEDDGGRGMSAGTGSVPSATGGVMGTGAVSGSGASVGSGGIVGTGATTSSGGGTSGCTDACPAPAGVEWQCKKRFMLGANWAWRDFGTDFGGLDVWGRKGVSEDAAAYSAEMAELKAGGSTVIRWWMFPRFLTDSIQWGGDNAPSGISGTLIADVQKALELAEQNDVYLMLTPFSFDNFKYENTESGGVYSRSINEMATDATKRQKLLDNLIRPVAKAVEESPYKHRMLAWDLINEPEMAMTGNNPYGAEAFNPLMGMNTMTHAQMKAFLDALGAVLREESSALLTIGSASIGWASAWSQSDIDFYQVHYYDWVYYKFPYSNAAYSPANMGIGDKPVVMGEYPYRGLTAGSNLPSRTLAELLNDLWTYGYAGALGWSKSDLGLGGFDASTQKTFADAHACESKY
jgi:hypothetical protein